MSPTITSLSPTAGPAAGGNSVTITGTGFTGPATVRFGGTATTFTIASTTQITAIAPAGTGTVQVTVTTSAGTSNGAAYTYSGTPSLTSVSPGQGPTSGANTVTLTGTNLTGATAVTFGTTAAGSFTVVSATQITAAAPAGTGTVQITVTTAGGVSNGVGYTYVPVPSLTGVSPNSGPPAGGTTVTLTGTNLAGATAVTFGTTAAGSFTAVSATQITATAPAGTGTVQITVTTAGGVSNDVGYTYVPVPSLISVSPNQGPTSGGNAVTLTGTNLTNATRVTFGTTAAVSFTVVSATRITAVVPVGGAGAVGVTVVTPGGASTLLSSYFYLNIPALAEAAPTSGPLAGANTVTLTGMNLTAATTVMFGTTAATSFTVVSATQITATAPAGTGTVQITATTPGGVSNAVPYTYLMAPTITGLSPNQGPTTGGNTVTITGTNLAQTTTVLFGTTPAAFTVVSNSQIVAIAPAGAGGPANVTVTTPGGISTAATYTRVAPPTI
ncbi:beta strand repeat-containing protein [Nocardia vaccinii]|uniref:beta strand repeat-containing protein n=1 Tax=Nocardia vaccinii TaxID=1822 RepID=UPI000B15AE0F|nr:IPT/TIG domain-containing protein [Nocardia vaccinii]